MPVSEGGRVKSRKAVERRDVILRRESRVVVGEKRVVRYGMMLIMGRARSTRVYNMLRSAFWV